MSTYSRYEATRAKPPSGLVDPTVSTSPGRGTASGRSSSVSAKLKTAQLAPMPIASETIETMVKPGSVAKDAKPMAHVAREILDPRQAALFAIAFCRHVNTAQLEQCDSFRLVRRHPRAQVIVDVGLQVRVEFRHELAVVAASTEGSREA